MCIKASIPENRNTVVRAVRFDVTDIMHFSFIGGRRQKDH